MQPERRDMELAALGRPLGALFAVPAA